MKIARPVALTVMVSTMVALAMAPSTTVSARASAPPARVELGSLAVGDKAPPLAIATWVKGEPVATIEPGTIYIIDFWAVWCGPCIAAMPHLTEVQAQYADKNLVAIGITTPDDSGNTLEAVRKLVASKGDTIGFRIAWDDAGQTNAAYMVAASMPVLPTTFIINREGVIAWIGSPFKMDEPLSKIIDGTWDIAAARTEFKKNQAYGTALMGLSAASATKDAEQLLKHGRSLIQIAGDNQMSMAILASSIVDAKWKIDVKANPELAALALDAANRANTASGGTDPKVLELLARTHFVRSEMPQAIACLEQAILHADADHKATLEATLKSYRAAK